MHYQVKKHGDSPATRIVSAILEDVTDRRGWRQAWDQFDKDIQKEIVKKWLDLVREELDVGD